MLLIKQTLKKAVPEGGNIAERTQTGARRIEILGGYKMEPIMECVAVGGLPFHNHVEVIAPLSLRVGDEIEVDAETGSVVAVKRDGDLVWPAPPPQKGSKS